MTNINSYLTFNGNCREAMSFYKDCLGGELTFQTIGESPIAGKMFEKMKECILHSTLTNNNLMLMASDMVPGSGLIKGNNVSMILNCTSEQEVNEIYKKLSEGGEASHKPEISFWGALFGDLTDKYGNHWLLNCEMSK